MPRRSTWKVLLTAEKVPGGTDSFPPGSTNQCMPPGSAPLAIGARTRLPHSVQDPS